MVKSINLVNITIFVSLHIFVYNILKLLVYSSELYSVFNYGSILSNKYNMRNLRQEYIKKG